MSRYGRISRSLMNAQRIRVISSPSSSTTGFFTLIFATGRAMLSAQAETQKTLRGAAAVIFKTVSTLGGERKIATMLFADLVGSTRLATQLDPEDLRGRLEPFFEAARGALEQHGGTVEKYIGDAVMAVFGAPVAHGDDPDRAVAAGLEVARRVGELDEELAVRVGIETGEVLSIPEAGNLRVTGEAVIAAARLQQAAQPGEVLV